MKALFWTVNLVLFMVETTAAQCLSAPQKDFSAATTVRVSNVTELHSAVTNLQSDTRILIAPGTYLLESTLYITQSDVVIAGDSQDCNSVVLVGKGMENSNYGAVGSGVWINSDRVSVANLTIRDVYLHPIELNSGPDDIQVYNVSMLNAGQQFLKASSAGGFGQGSDRGRVEYSTMEYLTNPPRTDHGGGTGYTNGVDVHGGTGWLIKNNLFKNFHTRDTDDHLWNPAILMWNGSADTIAENNTFINVDRAIAFGLINRSNDHSGGIIRNNMIYIEPNLYSSARKNNSDGQIIVWSSPNTKVLHNTIRTNGNTNKSIELRFGSSGVEVVNNLIDAPIVYREGLSFSTQGNQTITGTNVFVNEANGDLHLTPQSAANYFTGTRHPDVPKDFDGQDRGASSVYVGADSFDDDTTVKPTDPAEHTNFSPLFLLLLDEDN